MACQPSTFALGAAMDIFRYPTAHTQESQPSTLALRATVFDNPNGAYPTRPASPPSRFAIRRTSFACQGSRGLPSEARTKASEGWWAHQDSNLERAGYEPAALPLSYGPMTVYAEVLNARCCMLSSRESRIYP